VLYSQKNPKLNKLEIEIWKDLEQFKEPNGNVNLATVNIDAAIRLAKSICKRKEDLTAVGIMEGQCSTLCNGAKK